MCVCVWGGGGVGRGGGGGRGGGVGKKNISKCRLLFLLSILSVNQLCDGNAMLKPHTINRVEACGTIDSHSVQFDHRRVKYSDTVYCVAV